MNKNSHQHKVVFSLILFTCSVSFIGITKNLTNNLIQEYSATALKGKKNFSCEMNKFYLH